MTKLSVNINKIATLRNARGGNTPDLIQMAIDCQAYGAEGITVHPRPDERHIRYEDVYNLRPVVHTEFNIEGNPTRTFIDLVLRVKPEQVTLVPDEPNAITSNSGWDTLKHKDFLKEIITEFKAAGIRTSVFLDPVESQVRGALETGTDRIELYTESFAHDYPINPEKAIYDFVVASKIASELGLGINAGHDLNLQNLKYFNENIEDLVEVSIGHALISDSLYYGIHNTIQLYKNRLL